MVWKEPGKNQGPWNSGERPPDFERMVQNLQRRLRALFGGGGGRGSFHAANLLWLIPLVLAVWLLSGFYSVSANDRGVTLLFGRYAGTSLPGRHWHLPWPAGRVIVVSGAAGRSYSRSYNRLLTADGEVVSLEATVGYHIDDLRAYLFATAGTEPAPAAPDAGSRLLLGALADSTVRSAVAHASFAELQGPGRERVEAAARAALAAAIARSHLGIVMTRLAIQKVDVPGPVRSAYAEVKKAEQDSRQAQDAARRYASSLLPQARQSADRQIEEAKLYKTELLAQAQAEVARFDELLTAYRRAPGLMRDQLYFETMEEVLGKVRKVVMDGRGGNVAVYFGEPLRPARVAAPSAASRAAPAAASRAPAAKGGG